jgi:hypothetical protein
MMGVLFLISSSFAFPYVLMGVLFLMCFFLFLLPFFDRSRLMGDSIDFGYFYLSFNDTLKTARAYPPHVAKNILYD